MYVRMCVCVCVSRAARVLVCMYVPTRAHVYAWTCKLLLGLKVLLGTAETLGLVLQALCEAYNLKGSGVGTNSRALVGGLGESRGLMSIRGIKGIRSIEDNTFACSFFKVFVVSCNWELSPSNS